MKRPEKRAERAALRLTDREVSHIRAMYGLGSSRRLLTTVDRIVSSHERAAIESMRSEVARLVEWCEAQGTSPSAADLRSIAGVGRP